MAFAENNYCQWQLLSWLVSFPYMRSSERKKKVEEKDEQVARESNGNHEPWQVVVRESISDYQILVTISENK